MFYNYRIFLRESVFYKTISVDFFCILLGSLNPQFKKVMHLGLCAEEEKNQISYRILQNTIYPCIHS